MPIYVNRNIPYIRIVPPRHEGRFGRSSPRRGAGCDGRSATQDMRRDADGQAVWSRPLDAGVKFIEMIDERRWLKSPIHRGEHGAAEKNHRAGNAGSCRRPVVTLLVGRLPFSAHEAAGAAGARHSLRPLLFEGHGFFAKPGCDCTAATRRHVSTPVARQRGPATPRNVGSRLPSESNMALQPTFP